MTTFRMFTLNKHCNRASVSNIMVGPVAFPVAKLGVLVVKQISKPLARMIGDRARRSRVFRDWVCVPLGQGLHFYEVKLKMSALNIGGVGRVTRVPRLSQSQAVEQGSEVLSEIIILGVAVGVLIYEYRKNKEEKQEEETAERLTREFIKTSIAELDLKVEKQNKQICHLLEIAIQHEREFNNKTNVNELNKALADMSNNHVMKPLVLCEDNSAEIRNRKHSIIDKNKNKMDIDKSLSEEFIELVEEVAEELLDVINPDDDD